MHGKMSISMPPHDLFTPAKVFIKPKDQPEAEWKEVVGSVVRDSLTISESEPVGYNPTIIKFTAALHISRKNRIRLFKSVGLMKRPRLTYKTIKRDCAKRNK